MADGATIQIEVRDNAAAAAQSLERLAASLDRVRQAVAGGMRLRGLANQLSNLSSAVSGAVTEDAISRVERLAAALQQLQAMGTIRIRIPQNVARAADTMAAAQQPRESAVEQAPQMTETVSNAGRLQSLMEGLRSVAESAGRGLGEFAGAVGTLGGAAGRAISSLRPLVQAMTSLAGGVLRTAVTGIRGLASGIGKTVKTFSALKDKLSLSNTALGRMLSAIKRVAMYRLVRTAIKAVTDSLKTGIENLYQYSKAMGTQFAKSMDIGSGASLKFKNSIAAMLAPAIQAAIPLLVALANAAIAAANAIQMVFAVLSGSGVWYRATDAVNDYAKAAGGAGGAMKNLLADWDELNVIQSQGGGGGGGMQTAFADMFKQEEVEDNEWTRMAKDIKDAINRGDWYGVGQAIADRVNGLIDQMKPKEWAEKLNRWIRNGISLAIGMLETVDFADLGKKIGQFFMEIFGTGNTINWELIGHLLSTRILAVINGLSGLFSTPGLFEGIGRSFATLVNSIFQIDAGHVGRIIAEGINGAVKAAQTFIHETDYIMIGLKIRTFLLKSFGGGEDGIDWNAIGRMLKDGALKAIGALGELLRPDGEGAGLFTSIGGQLAEFVNGIFSFTDEQKQQFVTTLNDGIKDAIGGVDRFFADTDWNKIGEDLAFWIENIDWEGIARRLWAMIGKIFEAASTIGDYIVMGIVNSIAKAWNSTILGDYLGQADMFGDVDAFRKWFDTGSTEGLILNDEGRYVMPKTVKTVEDMEKHARETGRTIEQTLNGILADTSDFTLALAEANSEVGESAEEALDQIAELSEGYSAVMSEGAYIAEELMPVAIKIEPILSEMNFDEVVSNPINTYIQSHKEEEIPVGFEFQPVETATADLMVQDMYEQLRQAINAYDPESADVPSGRYFNETLSPIIDGIIDASGLIGEAAVSISDALYESWNSSLYDEDWEGSTDGLLSILSDAIEGAVPDTLPAIDTSPLTTSFQNAADSVKKSAAEIISAAHAVSSISIGGGLGIGAWSIRPIAHFASGGYPTAGSLFIANEAGPEYVGTMNGRTAVANSDQIVSGVASGVAAGQAEQNALLRQQNQLLTRMLNKEFTAKAIPGSDWGRFIHQSNSAYERQTGR